MNFPWKFIAIAAAAVGIAGLLAETPTTSSPAVKSGKKSKKKKKARKTMAAKKRAFISFDYDNDADLKVLLVGQSKHPDTPFDISDFSIKEHLSGDWKAKARTRIKGCDVVIVICGERTHLANGVAAELLIAQEEGVSYFLLKGRGDKTCTKPTTAKTSDSVYNWKWDNLKALMNGDR